MIEFFFLVLKFVVVYIEVLFIGIIGKEIVIYKKKGEFFDLNNILFVILGVKENRNDENFLGEDIFFEIFWKLFYSLYLGNWLLYIVDFGDIEKGEIV